MITNICLLLEILSVLLCVHCLYGEKVKLDIVTTSFLAVYMIIMAAINYYGLPKGFTMFVHPIVAIYCGMRFGFKIRALIINNILYIAIISGIQIVTAMFYYYFFGIQLFLEKDLLFINGIAFVVVLTVLPKCKLNKLSKYLQDKERIFIIALFISIVIAIYCLVQYKKIDKLGLYQYVLLFVCIIFICFLVTQIGKYKMKSKEIETELKTHRIYEDSFHNLIDNIRLRQHEFDNHINAINNLHYMCDTYEELVSKQGKYCEVVIKENHFNKLLKAGNPLVIGFLYGKFVEADKLGIEVDYVINIEDLDVGIPTYKLVEILGNLIKNAIEAIEKLEKVKVLYVEMIEVDGEFKIEIRNKSEFMPQNKMEMFFKKGYSQKGEGRGFGLYNVKTICANYSLNIICQNKDINGENWLSFTIDNKKRNH
ncbi:MAG: GHKL domain-containing protein [Lachnospiraceae bacterium]|nr:GHKL domain-containing protein [Lachnospiraceae bacterium]